MAATGVEGSILLIARLLFGSVIAYMGLNHFRRTEQMVDYAQYKGVPAPKPSVLGSGAVLVLGGVAIVIGVLPAVGALAVAAFLVVAALTMHDFWAVSEDQRQDEMIQFLKNIALAGGALAMAVLGLSSWGYGLGIRLF